MLSTLATAPSSSTVGERLLSIRSHVNSNSSRSSLDGFKRFRDSKEAAVESKMLQRRDQINTETDAMQRSEAEMNKQCAAGRMFCC